MVEAFRAAGVPLFVSYYRSLLPKFQQVKQILDAGRIGTVVSIDYRLSKPVGKDSWRLDPRVNGGGGFYDLAGHILDLFFQKSLLDRRAVVATKAVCQTFGHVGRIAYFGTFAAAWDTSLPMWQYVSAVALAIVGTTFAAKVLLGMTNEGFRRWSRWIVVGISIVYLARGLWLLIAG